MLWGSIFRGLAKLATQQLEAVLHNIQSVLKGFYFIIAWRSLFFVRAAFVPNIIQNNCGKWLASDLEMCLHLHL